MVPRDDNALARVEQALDDVKTDEPHASRYEDHGTFMLGACQSDRG
jgi:hypothetical protein